MYGVSSPVPSSRRRRAVKRTLTVAISAVAALVVVLLILIAGGVLVLPGHTTTPVTISYLQVRVVEGMTAGGMPWFGVDSPEKNYTDGYPVQVAPGGSFNATLFFFNYDNVSHTLHSIRATTTPTESVQIASTEPALPLMIPPSPESIEGQNFVVDITMPSTPGATFVLMLNISAIPTP